MAIDTYTLLSKTYLKGLLQLKAQMEIARKHAQQQDYSEDSYLTSKLAPDMFAFARQVQIVSDNAKGVYSRLGGREVPAWSDEEKTLEELIGRIERTIQYASEFNATDFTNCEKKEIVLPWAKGKHMLGDIYLTSFAIPNFYFHLVTAYNILRNAGVKIGKPDFIGIMEYA